MKTASPYLENLLAISAKAFDAEINEEFEGELMSEQASISNQISISANETEIEALITEASQLLRNSSDRTLELFNRVFNALYTAGKIIRIDVDRASTNTRELRILFKPTDCFRNLVTALRAGNIDDFCVEIDGHSN